MHSLSLRINTFSMYQISAIASQCLSFTQSHLFFCCCSSELLRKLGIRASSCHDSLHLTTMMHTLHSRSLTLPFLEKRLSLPDSCTHLLLFPCFSTHAICSFCLCFPNRHCCMLKPYGQCLTTIMKTVSTPPSFKNFIASCSKQTLHCHNRCVCLLLSVTEL